MIYRSKNGSLRGCRLGRFSYVEFRNYRTLSYRPAPQAQPPYRASTPKARPTSLRRSAFSLTGRSFRTTRLAEFPAGDRERGGVRVSSPRRGNRTVRRTIAATRGRDLAGDGGVVPVGARRSRSAGRTSAILNGAPAARRDFIDGFAGAALSESRADAAPVSTDSGRARNRSCSVRCDAGAAARLGALGRATGDGRHGADRPAPAGGRRAADRDRARVSGDRRAARRRLRSAYRSAIGEATEAGGVRGGARARCAAEEIRRGQTLVGPHRDDLAIELDGVDARAFGSRGQQRLAGSGAPARRGAAGDRGGGHSAGPAARRRALGARSRRAR